VPADLIPGTGSVCRTRRGHVLFIIPGLTRERGKLYVTNDQIRVSNNGAE